MQQRVHKSDGYIEPAFIELTKFEVAAWGRI
jgi:hypothetical protein